MKRPQCAHGAFTVPPDVLLPAPRGRETLALREEPLQLSSIPSGSTESNSLATWPSECFLLSRREQHLRDTPVPAQAMGSFLPGLNDQTQRQKPPHQSLLSLCWGRPNILFWELLNKHDILIQRQVHCLQDVTPCLTKTTHSRRCQGRSKWVWRAEEQCSCF